MQRKKEEELKKAVHASKTWGPTLTSIWYNVDKKELEKSILKEKKTNETIAYSQKKEIEELENKINKAKSSWTATFYGDERALEDAGITTSDQRKVRVATKKRQGVEVSSYAKNPEVDKIIKKYGR